MLKTQLKIKKSVADLAILGGAPLFSRELHVGYPEIGERSRFLEMANDIFDRRRLTNNGPYVREFEEKIAEFCGVKYCVALCNGTTGLELAIRALELKGEVILPAMTFVATAHALFWLGIKPVFCEVNPQTLCSECIYSAEYVRPKN